MGLTRVGFDVGFSFRAIPAPHPHPHTHTRTPTPTERGGGGELKKKEMSVEFQVYSATLEDRYPPGLPMGTTRDEVATDGVHEREDGVHVPKARDGCVGFLFGRDAAGRSVCVRVEGVLPKLFFAMRRGDTADAVRRELAAEVARDGGVHVDVVNMAHGYGYEPDVASASGRRVHAYAQASYTSLAAWRAACELRRRATLSKLQCELLDAHHELETLARTATGLRSALMVTSASASHADATRSAHEAAEQRARLLRDKVVPGLQRRIGGIKRDDDAHSAAAPVSGVREAHEAFVEPLTRFFAEARITPGAWVRVARAQPVDVSVTTCDVEVSASADAFVPLDDRALDAPYRTLYYDIETLGLEPEHAPVIQVSMVIAQRDAPRERHLVALGEVAPIDGVVVHACATEAQVLRAVRRVLVRADPDFLVAYNGVNFDNRYLAERAKAGRADADDVHDFWYASRFALRRARLRELRLSSAGMGDNLLRYLDLPGRATFDWYVKFKRDLASEPRYSLNHFAAKFCGGDKKKEDVAYTEIPALQAGTPTDRARLGKYCVVDAELLDDLDAARAMIVEILQFAAVFCVLPEWIYFRGQQVRFIAVLLRKARTAEAVPLLLNRPAGGFVGEGVASYEGATVNEPKRGFYKTPVATLDWMSLYPSIMRAHNLCHSTHVLDAALHGAEGVREYRISDDFVAHFATAARHKGLLPRILEELHTERSAAKRAVKEHTARAHDASLSDAERAREAALARVFDGRQKALKVSANSVYGAAGATDAGKYPDLAVSAVVTLQGRDAMVIKKRILPERFPGIDVIYGDTDSVMVTFADAPDVASCAALAEQAADFVTRHFADLGYGEMVLEFEKIFFPYLLEAKKRYAGLKYEPAGDGSVVCKGVDCKGLETERRDTLPFVKEVMRGCLDKLLYAMDERAALAHFETHMATLVRDEVPFDAYVMRKNLSAKVVSKTDTIVHARVNALRRARNPGSEAATNEQVEYVIVAGHRKEKTTMLAEDPSYAREHGIKLNRLWYFEHAIEEPVRKLFAVFDTIDFASVCDRVRAELDRERLGVGGGMSALFASDGTDRVEDVTPRAPGAPRAPEARPFVPRPFVPRPVAPAKRKKR